MKVKAERLSSIVLNFSCSICYTSYNVTINSYKCITSNDKHFVNLTCFHCNNTNTIEVI